MEWFRFVLGTPNGTEHFLLLLRYIPAVIRKALAKPVGNPGQCRGEPKLQGFREVRRLNNEHVEEGGKLHLKYQHSEDQLSNFLKTEVFVHLVTFLNPTAAK